MKDDAVVSIAFRPRSLSGPKMVQDLESTLTMIGVSQ